MNHPELNPAETLWDRLTLDVEILRKWELWAANYMTTELVRTAFTDGQEHGLALREHAMEELHKKIKRLETLPDVRRAQVTLMQAVGQAMAVNSQMLGALQATFDNGPRQ